MASAAANGKPPPESHVAMRVFGLLTTANPADNVLISPLLLEAMLALLYLGADGSTADDLRLAAQLERFGNNIKMANYYASVLEGASGAPETSLQISNEIFVHERCAVGEEFAKIAQKYFRTHAAVKCDLKNTDALRQHVRAAVARIAASARMAEGGGVGSALWPPAAVLEADEAVLVLTAAYFKNKWFLPFSAYRTGIYEFQAGAGGEAVPVAMLYDSDMFVKFGEFRELDARAIELPYEHDDDNELAMLLLLPNRRDGLAALLERLRTADWAALAERMQMESVQVLLPKFRIDFACSLRSSLAELGLSGIFSKEANFKNLLEDNAAERLHVADVLHRVCLEVNESGSEPASSGTAYKPIVVSNSIDSKHKFFRADHPFVFAIRNRDVTYFIGQVAKF